MKYLKISQVSNLTTLSKSSIYELIKNGQFPKSNLIGARRVAWLESEVHDWIRIRSKK